MTLSSEEYVKKSGLVCPFCDSREISGGSFEADSDYASREVRCLGCNKEWLDHYTLTGYQEVDY